MKCKNKVTNWRLNTNSYDYCYIYITVGKELSRYELKEYAVENGRLFNKRNKRSLNSILGDILSAKGYVPSDTADGWPISGEDAGPYGLHEGQRSDGTSDYSKGDSSLFRITPQIIL